MSQGAARKSQWPKQNDLEDGKKASRGEVQGQTARNRLRAECLEASVRTAAFIYLQKQTTGNY